jgi:hypothetical protein
VLGVTHYTWFGHLTLNIIKSVNRVLKLNRELLITLLLAVI